MSSKQTRRSISVRGTTYFTLRQYCEDHDRSMSDLVEELLAKVFAGAGDTTPLDAPVRSIKAAKPVAAPRALAAKVLRAPMPAKPAPVSLPAATPVEAAPTPTKAVAKAAAAPIKASPAKVAPMPAKSASAPAEGQNGGGRPAPTPAKSVVADRVVAPKGDYRIISF